MQKLGTLHLLCGLPGTGKSTYAKKLEGNTKGVVLNHDVWLVGIFGPNAPDDFERNHATIWRLLWELAERLLTLGVDVILDFGLWYRFEREDFRKRALSLGAQCKLHFVTCSPTVQERRIQARNMIAKDRNLSLIHI